MSKISGHNFHFEIEDRIKAKKWDTVSKQSYLDDVELRPREIDFIASQNRESYNPRGNKVALVVECKYLNHNTTFYFRPNPKDHNAYFLDGYPKEELFRGESKFHFFTPEKVAVSIDSDAMGKDSMYEAIMQASKALMYLRQGGQLLYTKGLFYPLVVYKGTGKISDQDGNELKDILYYHRYEWRDTKTQDTATRSLYVNIIHESNVENYLDNVFKREMDNLMEHIFFRNKMQEKNSKPRSNPAR